MEFASVMAPLVLFSRFFEIQANIIANYENKYN